MGQLEQQVYMCTSACICCGTGRVGQLEQQAKDLSQVTAELRARNEAMAEALAEAVSTVGW